MLKYSLKYYKKLDIYEHRLIERFCLMTILKFSLLIACKSNHRVERSRYWGLIYEQFWFSFPCFLRFRKEIDN